MIDLVPSFDSHMPGWQALPGFLAQTKYRNPSDNAHCAFQIGHNTDLLPFIWVLNHPDRFAAFNLWMSAGREGKQIFLDVYPFEKDLCHDLTPETPLFVDVGGGIGQQCVALKQRFPNAPGRVILQEMPQTLEQAIKAEGVELMAYDFWTPQPIKGIVSLHWFSQPDSSNRIKKGHELTTCAISCTIIPMRSASRSCTIPWLQWIAIPSS